MEYHKIADVVMVILLCGGLYLPTVRQVVRSESAVRVLLALSVIPVVGTLYYDLAVFIPIFYGGSNVSDKVLNLISGIICSNTAYKIYAFYFARNHLDRVIRLWDTSDEDVVDPALREEMLLNMKKTNDRWILTFGFFIIGSACIFCAIPFYTRVLEHPLAIPYPRDFPLFDIYVLLEFAIVVSASAAFHSYNSLLLQNVAMESAVCEYLKKSLANIMSLFKVSTAGRMFLDLNKFQAEDKSASAHGCVLTYHEVCVETERKLRIWIQEHQLLIRFHEELRSLYHVPLSVDFVASGIIICLEVFLILQNAVHASVLFVSIAYCATVYSIFYVTCFYGDLTEIGSESLHQDAFQESWYVLPRKIRVAFQIISIRCKKPMTLTAFSIYPLGSSSFTKIFKTAYTLFTFLLHVMNRAGEGPVI